MRTRYFKIIIVVAALCVITLMLAGAASGSENTEIRLLLEKRCAVMQNMLLGSISYEEGKEQLKEIEKGKLYSDDLKAVMEYRNTDLEKIQKMDVISVRKEGDIYGKQIFRAEIEWTMSGIGGISRQTCTYDIGADEENGERRLISLELREKE